MCPGLGISIILGSKLLHLSPFSSAWTVFGKVLEAILIEVLFCCLLRQESQGLSWGAGKKHSSRAPLLGSGFHLTCSSKLVSTGSSLQESPSPTTTSLPMPVSNLALLIMTRYREMHWHPLLAVRNSLKPSWVP